MSVQPSVILQSGKKRERVDGTGQGRPYLEMNLFPMYLNWWRQILQEEHIHERLSGLVLR